MENFNIILSDTFNRIEEALNIRFEKDTSLYIKKSDEEKVKKAITEGHHQNLSALAKKLGEKIIAVVILKNSWLISPETLKKCKRSMAEIFDSLDESFMLEISKDILSDNVYSSIEFKELIESYYIKQISIEDCKKIFLSEENKLSTRAYCYARYISNYCISKESGKEIAEKIDYDLNHYREIKNYLNKNNWILPKALTEIEDSIGLCSWIMTNIHCNPIEKIWESILLSFKLPALKSGYQYVDKNPYYANENTKYIVQKLFPALTECTDFQKIVFELYESHREIRILFINMINPQKFKNKELAHKLLNAFEYIGVNPNWLNRITIIKEWQISTRRFNNTEEFIQYLDDNTPDITNQRVLGFYTSEIAKNRSLINELLDGHGERTDIQYILGNYLANSLSKGSTPHISQLNLTQDYVDRIVYFIEKNHINSQNARDFLGEQKKFNVLEKLNRR